jgi:hypothetical protein
MKKVRFTLIVFVFAIFGLTASSMVQAQATRTWVSGVGDDVNPCSRTAPCKTFAGAISKTAAGGEIDALDSGGFGAVTITKSLTIDGGGILASVLNSSTNGINISATAGDVVTLRNLAINGSGGNLPGGTGLRGVNISGAGAVHIINCQIFNQGGSPGQGIADTRTNVGAKLFITDTVVRNNGGTAVFIAPASGLVTASLNRVHLIGNGNTGVYVSNGRVTISDSVVSENTNHGLFADTATGQINAENTRVSGNGGFGVVTTNGATISLSNAVIVNNGTGFSNGGTINTFSNNKITGNAGANVGALTPVGVQ